MKVFLVFALSLIAMGCGSWLTTTAPTMETGRAYLELINKEYIEAGIYRIKDFKTIGEPQKLENGQYRIKWRAQIEFLKNMPHKLTQDGGKAGAVRVRHGTMTFSKTGAGLWQGEEYTQFTAVDQNY